MIFQLRCLVPAFDGTFLSPEYKEALWGKLTDAQIRDWIRRGERFEAKSDGEGLYLRFRSVDAVLRKLPDGRRSSGYELANYQSSHLGAVLKQQPRHGL
jgi:hypothetical protein